jgi:UDP-N-acetylglucosamine pyrophosphorylase
MDEVNKILKENNQEHLLRYINLANDDQKKTLIDEIKGIDFTNLKRLYNTSKMNNEEKLRGEKIEHISYVDKYKLSNDEAKRLEKIGNDIIKNNQYAVVTMAGGQGTRLGHSGPKGTFLLNVKPELKYLFQIIAEGLEKNNAKVLTRGKYPVN